MIKQAAIASAFWMAFTTSAMGDLLWDNDLVPNGVDGRAASPPGFPDMRLADDFTVSDEGGWIVQGFHVNVLEAHDWDHGGVMEVVVFEDVGAGPGAVVGEHSGPFERMDTGDIYVGRLDYDYWIEGIDIFVGPGDYYVGFRNPEGGGAGTNYWMTSDGGADGRDSGKSWMSLNGGDTWEEDPSERFKDYAWQIGGVPEPSGALLIGVGALAVCARRRGRRA